jgi:hypothetical protein
MLSVDALLDQREARRLKANIPEEHATHRAVETPVESSDELTDG